jgi:hypothetical protein
VYKTVKSVMLRYTAFLNWESLLSLFSEVAQHDIFQKFLRAQNSEGQERDMKEFPHCRLTNTGSHSTKFSRRDDLNPRDLYTPVIYTICSTEY